MSGFEDGLRIEVPVRIEDGDQELLSDDEVRTLMRAIELIRELQQMSPLLDKLNRVCGVHYTHRDKADRMLKDGQMLGWYYRHIVHEKPIPDSPSEYVALLEYALNHELTVE